MKEAESVIIKNKKFRQEILDSLQLYYQDIWFDPEGNYDEWLGHPYASYSNPDICYRDQEKKEIDAVQYGRIYVMSLFLKLCACFDAFEFLEIRYDSPKRYKIQVDLITKILKQDNKFKSYVRQLYEGIMNYDPHLAEIIDCLFSNDEWPHYQNAIIEHWRKDNTNDEDKDLAKFVDKTWENMIGRNYCLPPQKPSILEIMGELIDDHQPIPPARRHLFIKQMENILNSLPKKSQRGKQTKYATNFLIKCIVDIYKQYANISNHREYFEIELENLRNCYKKINHSSIIKDLICHLEVNYRGEIGKAKKEPPDDDDQVDMKKNAIHFVATIFYYMDIDKRAVSEFAFRDDFEIAEIPKPEDNHFVRKVYYAYNNKSTIFQYRPAGTIDTNWDLLRKAKCKNSEKYLKPTGFGFNFGNTDFDKVFLSLDMYLFLLSQKNST